MNYLCQYQSREYFVKFSSKDWSKYIKTSILISFGGPKFKVIQANIEIKW